MKRKLITSREVISFILVLSVLLGLDLWTKYLFYNLALYKDAFLIEPVINTGISFSLDVSYLIVLPFSLLALCGFAYLYYYKSFSSIVTLLLIAGTLGNLYDRIVYDGVRDFIVMPGLFVFNLADTFLSIGIVMFILYTYNQKNI